MKKYLTTHNCLYTTIAILMISSISLQHQVNEKKSSIFNLNSINDNSILSVKYPSNNNLTDFQNLNNYNYLITDLMLNLTLSTTQTSQKTISSEEVNSKIKDTIAKIQELNKGIKVLSNKLQSFESNEDFKITLVNSQKVIAASDHFLKPETLSLLDKYLQEKTHNDPVLLKQILNINQ